MPLLAKASSGFAKILSHVNKAAEMISEVTTKLEPAAVLDRARQFFLGAGSIHAASLSEESESHLTFTTFRDRLAIAAYPDPGGHGTRVRVSTLRPNQAVGKLLAFVSSNGTGSDQ
ncbi:MAG: hypothetical protein ABFS14_01500 [Gemmatimonadota bacterium]